MGREIGYVFRSRFTQSRGLISNVDDDSIDNSENGTELQVARINKLTRFPTELKR